MTSYLLQVNIAITVFYVFYRLFLREKRYFGANRLYLNGALLLSFLLPALPSSGMSLIAGMHSVTTPVTESIYPLYPVRLDPVELSAERVETAWGLGDWLLLVYAAGVLFLLGSFFYRLGKLALLYNKNAVENHAGYCLVLFSHPVPAFTFFRTIFISKKDLYNSRPWILQHEQVHARQLHTLDILLAELAQIICWFNPLLGWYQREMKCVHEYIADAGIPEEEKGDYARLLYEYTLSHYKNPVIHSFYTKNILKRRIKMIHQKNPSKRNWLYYLLILPLTGGLLLLMPGAGKVSPEELTEKLVPAEDNGRRIDISGRITDVSGQPVAGASVYVLETPKGTASDVKGNFTINRIPPDARLKVSRIGYQDVEIDVNKSRIINIKLSKSKERLPQEGLVIVGYSTKEDEPSAAPPAEKEPDESEVYTFASIEKRPEFEGGIRKFLEYVFKNTRYPAEARENNIQGEVEIGFTIDETGRVTDPEIIKGIGGGCDEELIRVMEDAPRWIPGEQNGVPVSVYYILPVNMELR